VDERIDLQQKTQYAIAMAKLMKRSDATRRITQHEKF
jgi:hypothetical protein